MFPAPSIDALIRPHGLWLFRNMVRPLAHVIRAIVLNPYRTNAKTGCTPNGECPAPGKYAPNPAVLDQNLPIAHNVTIGRK
jgi:hypothetical protein